MISLPIFSQYDSRWGDRKLVPSNLTMGNSGCYITSLTMALHNYAISHTPNEVLDLLIANHGLDNNGLLTYQGVMNAFPWVYFKERVYTSNDPSANIFKMDIAVALEKVRRLLDCGQPVILCVDNVGNDGLPDHAIVAFDYLTFQGKVADFQVNDPDGGKSILFSSKYGDVNKKLYGYVALIGPPIAFPEQSTAQRDGTAVWKASQVARGINVATYSREILDTLL